MIILIYTEIKKKVGLSLILLFCLNEIPALQKNYKTFLSIKA